MTEQEAFSKVWKVLSARGFTRAGVEIPPDYYDDKPRFVCRYRSPIGPCAAGIFISDEEYSEDFENKGIAEVLELNQHLTTPLRNFSRGFISDLQAAHDNGFAPSVMETQLRDFAESYKLEIPA